MIGSAPLSADEREIIRAAVADACLEVFRGTGLRVERIEAASAWQSTENDIAGFIGFSGRVRGSLLVAGSTVLFGNTYPSMEGSAQRGLVDLLDWAGELSNQTLGRIKRRFCERGVDFQSSTPTAVNGQRIEGRSPPRDHVFDLTFRVGDEVALVLFEIVAPAEGKIFGASAAIPCAQEGDLVLF